MRSTVRLFAVVGILSAISAFGQQPATTPNAPPQAPATDTIAPQIPGVVAGGTKVEVVKQGFRATDGPIALPDGTVLF
jgi:gluconolactonase